MKLLFVTQVVDRNDAVLGAYHGWFAALAPHFEKITLICLREGEHVLPGNIEVFSLGKEKGVASRWQYAVRFLKIVWQQRREYDTVFIHMNQEYILLAGWFWKLSGKKMYLWRNHYAGSLLTDLVALFCTKVFCTSKFSYTAKYKKTILMPVGIDTNIFKPVEEVVHIPHSILFLSRMSPSKRPEVLIDALALLEKRNVDFLADFYGSPLPKDEAYYDSLKTHVEHANLTDSVRFYVGVPNVQTPNIYSTHEIFVNTSRSGMFDKTLFEAAACGTLPLASSRDWAALVDPRLTFEEGNVEHLAEKSEALLRLPSAEVVEMRNFLQSIVQANSLDTLVRMITRNIYE
jgi:glycosyltransferase involved in cell wall biosynthesis